MNNFQKIALASALLFSGPAIWAAAWSFFYPSFQLMYWSYYREWTPTAFQNFLLFGISGTYIVGCLLIAWKGDTKTMPQELSPWPSLDPSPKPNSVPIPSPAPIDPQVSELVKTIRDVKKDIEEIRRTQAKIEPFLRLEEKGEKV